MPRRCNDALVTHTRYAGLGVAVLCAFALAGCGRSSLDLHKVNWRDVTIPGAFCGVPGRLHLQGGSWAGRIEPNRGIAYGDLWLVAVEITGNPVVYGDLGSAGQGSAAALEVDCNNGGGTADGVLAYAQVIFTAAGTSLRVIGVVTPKEQPKRQLPTFLTVTIRRGEVIAHEDFYGGSDGTCCPSGRATTIWRYANGHLQSGRPVITRHPTLLSGAAGAG